MIDAKETYYSNNGKGPMIAKIIEIKDGMVTLRRKSSEKGKRWVLFALKESFFNSESCGWKKR